MNSLKKVNRIIRRKQLRIYRKMGNTKSTYYHLSSGAEIEKSPGKFKLFQNYTDSSNTYVVIEFYLPKPANVKVILMDSDFTDSMYLLNKDLKAGRHILKTGIENIELLANKYYYKLEAFGVADTKEMRYTYKAVNN